MSNKQNLLREVGDVLEVLWNYLLGFVKWLGSIVSRVRISLLGKMVGLFLIITAAIAMVIDTVAALLLIGDPLQFGKIVYAATGVDIFAYIGLAEYIGIIAGGVIMDLAILTLVLWLGIYLYNGRNYFVRPARSWLYVCAMAVLGGAIFATSLFYLLPEMINLEQDLDRHYYHNKVYVPDYQYQYYEANGRGVYLLEQERRDMQQMMDELRGEYNIQEVYYR